MSSLAFLHEETRAYVSCHEEFDDFAQMTIIIEMGLERCDIGLLHSTEFT